MFFFKIYEQRNGAEVVNNFISRLLGQLTLYNLKSESIQSRQIFEHSKINQKCLKNFAKQGRN